MRGVRNTDDIINVFFPVTLTRAHTENKNMAAPQKYGLFLPKKARNPPVASRPSIFEDDSDDEHDKASIEASIKKESMRNLNKMQTQLQMQKAMEEDPTVFEYDEVYDDLKQVQEEKKTKITKDRTPRYIGNLMKAAEKRKKENERRAQHKIQKEREQEGEEYADKEAYVTLAYRKKMQEMQEEEEKEMRREQLDEMMSVTKQEDLSGFYRHLLKQTVGEEKIPDNTDLPATVVVKVERDDASIATPSREEAEGRRREHDDHGSSGPEFGKKLSVGQRHEGRKRYRRRNASEASDETATRAAEREVEENVDADDDFSVDSEDDTEEADKECADGGKKRKLSSPNGIRVEEKKDDDSGGRKADAEGTEPPTRVARQTDGEWIAMFEKRTVGDVFEAARARYFERKAARRAAGGGSQ